MARARLLAVVAPALLVLAACGSVASPESSGSSSSSKHPVEDGAFPVTVDHKYGTTTVKKASERIVVVGLKEQDDLLALGEVPVATTKWLDDTAGGIYPWAKERLGDAKTPQLLNQDDGVQVEKVAALRPDLIIGLYAGMTKGEYETLSKIAPTVAQPGDVPDYGISWQQEALTVGKAVGKPQAAKDLVDDVEAKVAKIADANPSLDGREALFASPYEGTYVYGSTDPRTRFLTDLGMRIPADIDKVVGTKEFGANISPERVDFLDVDALVWLADEGKERDTVLGNKAYTGLGVHRDGRDVFIGNTDQYGLAISFVTALSVPYTMERLAPQLSAAVDGRASTKVPNVKD